MGLLSDELHTHWEAAVRDIGGTVEHVRGGRLIAVSVDDCVIEGGTTPTGHSVITWLAANAPGSSGLRLAVSERGNVPFREAFSITSGDPEFDERFSIKTNDAPFARLWLDDRVRECIAATGRDYHFLLENGHCRAWRFAEEDDPEHLTRVALALAALSSRGNSLQREWMRLADRIGGRLARDASTWRPDGAISIHVKLGHTTVVVDGFFGALGRRRPGRGLFTRVRCPRHSLDRDHYVVHDPRGRRALRPRLPAPLRPLAVDHEALAGRRYRIECEDPEAAGARFGGAAGDRIAAAGPEIIIGEPHQVTLFFLGFETDPDRVRAGIGVAESLAVEIKPHGLAGPYR